MAGQASVLSDQSWVSRLDRRLLALETVLAFLAGLAVFGLMVLAVVSVSGRNLMNQPLPGYVDWIEQAMPLIAFLGISYVQRNGGHIRMDIVIGRLKGRALWLAEFVTTFAVLILIAALIWGSWAHFDRSFDWDARWFSRDSSIDIGLPIWPAKLIVPVAFSILGLRLVLQLWGYVRAIVTGTDAPVAVPLIQDAATQAAAEAEQLLEKD
ncbi:TRAP transporter small permease subunit [Mesobacterium pallidum]|uniref:TRAP transporter small permease subunit n=1 Tax=Mesobacterium pallidum TaxID=2872037 RepID=UPI001EE2F55D|nr:TRAP transporter small permease [Mesobacterium pallidum]